MGPVPPLKKEGGAPPGFRERMPAPARHQPRLAQLDAALPRSDQDARRPRHDHPLLRAEAMALKADPMAGHDHEALDLVTRAFHDVLESSPGPSHEVARLPRGPALLHGRGRHHAPRRTRRAETAPPPPGGSSAAPGATPPPRGGPTRARPRPGRR